MKKKPTVIKSFDQLGEVIQIEGQSYRECKAPTDITITSIQMPFEDDEYKDNTPSEPKRVSLLAKQKGRY